MKNKNKNGKENKAFKSLFPSNSVSNGEWTRICLERIEYEQWKLSNIGKIYVTSIVWGWIEGVFTQ